MSTSALLDRTAPSPAARPALRIVDDAPTAPATAGPAPRGFALYVGFDEAKAAASGVSLATIVEALRRTLNDLAPEAETYATVALAPAGAGGRDVDVVRLALHEPSAVARTKPEIEVEDRAEAGVVVDISRKRVLIDGESAAFSFKEFVLLQYLVLREGRTIERLRAKLGRFEDIVRTVRGVGYRFDRHADVVIRYGHGTPSPDRF
jgi:hypothetical protein